MCYVLCFYSSYKLKYREIKKLVYIKEKESRGKGRGQIYIIFKTKIIRNGQTCYQRTHVRYPSKVQHFIYRDITTFQKRGAPCPVNFRHKPFQFPNYTVVEDNAFNILKCLMGIWHMTKTMILWIQDCTREFFFFCNSTREIRSKAMAIITKEQSRQKHVKTITYNPGPFMPNHPGIIS